MSDFEKNLLESARIPDDPIGNADKLREDLIDQILELQSRYRFSGARRSRAWLDTKTTSWLERMNNFQIMAVATSMVPDRRLNDRRQTHRVKNP
ncbi:hypothetical protein [Streptomyces sp. 5-10]|uniref:hypothetical protein n=1 Tax=Streptomyces sp. 5-10 TaxID=878925 RepID=UPI00168B3B0B|nr:hypothetical protein [Streptomyces sp. 5-10]MBD3004845.1 hypothetical protein [Streptomyces sp. 5-10]